MNTLSDLELVLLVALVVMTGLNLYNMRVATRAHRSIAVLIMGMDALASGSMVVRRDASGSLRVLPAEDSQ